LETATAFGSVSSGRSLDSYHVSGVHLFRKQRLTASDNMLSSSKVCSSRRSLTIEDLAVKILRASANSLSCSFVILASSSTSTCFSVSPVAELGSEAAASALAASSASLASRLASSSASRASFSSCIRQLRPDWTGRQAHLFLLGLILDELLLLLQDFQSLLVGSSLGCIELGFVDLLVSLRDFWMDVLAYQVLGKTAECSDQGVHDIISLLLKVECSTENQEDTRYTVDVVQFNPGHEFLPETSG